MKLQDGQGCICDTALDTSSCGETLNRYMLDIDPTFPEDRKVLLVNGGNGRIPVCFGYVKQGSFSASRAGRHLLENNGEQQNNDHMYVGHSGSMGRGAICIQKKSLHTQLWSRELELSKVRQHID